MYTPFAKLLCATALASTALAQSISIISPSPGDSFNGGEQITVQLEESAIQSWQTLDEVALVIRAAGGAFDGSDLGNSDNAYQGVFAAQWTDTEGNKYANYSISAPNWINGAVSVNIAHYYLLGAYGTSKLEFATVGITVSGNSG